MTELENDLTQENQYPEMRKGFKGFWWNFFNCGKLSKEDQKKVMKKTLISGLIAMVILIVLITEGIFAVMGITRGIENAKPFSQVPVEAFRKNWNEAAKTDSDSVTEGVRLKKEDLRDSYNILPLEDSWITINRSGRDFETLTYTSEQYRTPENREAILREMLTLCMPEIDHTQVIQEHLAYEEKFVQDAIDGFRIHFNEAASAAEIEYSITMEYEYTYNIVAANTPTGCAFDCTFSEFAANYNEIVEDLFDENAQYLLIKSLPYTPDRTENYNDMVIDVYTYNYYNGTTPIAALAFFVERSSDKICQMRYTLGCDAYDNMSDELQIGYKESLPKAIFGAVGFSEYSVYDDYFMEAAESHDTGYTILKDGTQTGAGIIKVDDTEMLCFEMYAYGDEAKEAPSTTPNIEADADTDTEIVIASGSDTGSEFNCSFRTFVDRYNELNQGNSEDIAAADFKSTPSDSETTDIYTYYSDDKRYQFSVYVNKNTQNIMQFSYFLDNEAYDLFTVEEKEFYLQTQLSLFSAAIGFDQETVYNNCWAEAMQSENEVQEGLFSLHKDDTLFEFTVLQESAEQSWMAFNCVAKKN